MRDYAALCWPVLERLMAATLVSGMSTAAAARGSLSAVDRRDLREAAEHEEKIRTKATPCVEVW